MKFKNFLKRNTTIFLIAVIVILLLFEFYKGKFDIYNYIPNLITEIMGILITVFLVEKALEYKKVENEKTYFFEICNIEYKNLIYSLSTNFVNFVTHGKYNFNNNEATTAKINIEGCLEKIDEYIQRNFIIEPFKVIKIDKNDMFENETLVYDYFKYQKYIFKDPTIKEIDDFLSRYAFIIPKEIIERLYNILNILKKGTFANPLDFGIELDLKSRNVKFDDNNFKNDIKDIANNIIYLRDAMNK